MKTVPRKTHGERAVSNEVIYQEFIDWLKQAWPLPEADGLLPMITARYTPEAAAFLTGFPLQATGIEDLAELKGMAHAELTAKADLLAKQGLIFRSARGSDIRYRLNDAFFTFLRSSFWNGDTSKEIQDVASATNKYFLTGLFDNWEHAHQRGLRTLPIHETIRDMRQIMPYEEVIKVVDSFEYHSVSICPCRHRKNIDLDSPDCGHPDEVCLHFDELGRYCVENGMGREITPEETRAILWKAAQSGLVHGLSNMQKGADTICNCCKCCCMWLESHHVLGHAQSLTPSNYRVHADREECIACGQCVERCPMDAQSLEDYPDANNPQGKAATPDRERCIGCGVCVVTCPVDGLTLERIEDATEPPKDGRDFMMQFIRDQEAAHESRQ